MNPDPIAVWLNSYNRPAQTALQAARRDGFAAIQLSATGELDPKELSSSGRRHLAKILRNLGLRLPSIALEFPGAGLADPAAADARIEAFRRTLSLCTDLQVGLAEVSIGGFENPQNASLAREVLKYASEQADRAGVRLAISSALDSPIALAQDLAGLACPGVGLSLHADLLPAGTRLDAQTSRMVSIAALRDGRRVGGDFEETALGSGHVDLSGVIAALAGEAFPGPFTVRRSGSRPPVDGLRTDREYVSALLERQRR